jgi:hypothetical protein
MFCRDVAIPPCILGLVHLLLSVFLLLALVLFAHSGFAIIFEFVPCFFMHERIARVRK